MFDARRRKKNFRYKKKKMAVTPKRVMAWALHCTVCFNTIHSVVPRVQTDVGTVRGRCLGGGGRPKKNEFMLPLMETVHWGGVTRQTGQHGLMAVMKFNELMHVYIIIGICFSYSFFFVFCSWNSLGWCFNRFGEVMIQYRSIYLNCSNIASVVGNTFHRISRHWS